MNRRSFLKSTSILVGGLYLSGRAFGSILPQDRGEHIRGQVLSGRKRLRGVAVSDGFDVVWTDRKGRYDLKTNPEAKHIFISLPAGYQAKTIDGFAVIHRDILSGDYDFSLIKTPYDDTHHYFLALGDPQVRVKEDIVQFYEESIPDIVELLASHPKERFHGITLGDAIWDRLQMWTPYREGIARIGIPFFQVIGNHDKNEIGEDFSDNNTLFNENFGPAYYSFNRGKVHYIVLDNVRYTDIKNYDGFVSEEQLNWFEKDLSQVQKNDPLIISAHIPTYNAVKNNERLYTLLEGFTKVHFLSGHTHTHVNNVVSPHIMEHTHASLCGAWWTGSVCTDGTPRGYGVFEVNDNEVSWFYKSVGHDRDYQFRSYVQPLNHDLRRITVNVWNYDPLWKVEWRADRKDMGTLEQIKGYDELAVSLYKGDKLPEERRQWVEPRQTDHLFFTQTNAKSVEIIVTDRFGNIFNEKIQLTN